MTDTEKADTREPDFYDCREGQERLIWTDRDEAIEDYLGNHLGVLHPGMTEAEVLDALPETVTVIAYARMKPSDNPDRLAGRTLDSLLEHLDEEYGDPDGGSADQTDAMRQAARTFVDVVLSDYEPWACEIVSDEEVDVEAWVREHCPDWLTDDTKKDAEASGLVHAEVLSGIPPEVRSAVHAAADAMDVAVAQIDKTIFAADDTKKEPDK